MTLIEQLVIAATAGQRPRFADLPEEARIELTDTLVPHGRPFSEAERALFGAFRLELDPWGLELVEEFNALDHPHKVPVEVDADGLTVIAADLLTWCGQGDGYHGIQELLWHCGIVPHNPKPQADYLA
jgi:hypothetical protein